MVTAQTRSPAPRRPPTCVRAMLAQGAGSIWAVDVVGDPAANPDGLLVTPPQAQPGARTMAKQNTPPTDGAAPEAAYRLAFGFLATTLIVALVFYIQVGDAKPSRDPRDGSDPVL